MVRKLYEPIANDKLRDHLNNVLINNNSANHFSILFLSSLSADRRKAETQRNRTLLFRVSVCVLWKVKWHRF